MGKIALAFIDLILLILICITYLFKKNVFQKNLSIFAIALVIVLFFIISNQLSTISY